MHVDNFGTGEFSTRPSLPPMPPIQDRRLQLLRLASDVEANPDNDDPLCFGSRLLAQLSLPHRDPGAVPEWVRRNNALTLTLTPGPVTVNGERRRLYPYGVIPRYLLTWITTEVVKTKSRTLELGGSLAGFLKEVGLNSSGASGRRMHEQLQRLLVASLNIEDRREDERRRQIRGVNFNVARSYELWFGIDQADQPSLLPSTITLSEEFYAETLRSPVKLNPRVLKAFAGSPMKIDMYTWLAFRTRNLSRASVISWNQLSAQFGSDYAQQRQFKKKFLDHLDEVALFFPAKTLTRLPNGLRLNPRAVVLASKNSGTLAG